MSKNERLTLRKVKTIVTIGRGDGEEDVRSGNRYEAVEVADIVDVTVHIAFTYPPPSCETQEPILNGAGFTVDFPVHVVDESYPICDADDPVQFIS